MTKKVTEILDGMEQSHESAAMAVAEHLRTVADNGGQQSRTAYLIAEADNVILWAQKFIREATVEPKHKVFDDYKNAIKILNR